MTIAPPDPELVERFRRDVVALRVDPNNGLALAVSGGPDSMAMLSLAVGAFPGRILVATVDHRLRPTSAVEATMVARHCAELSVAHTTLPIEVPPGASGNLQGWARQERYLLLKRWAADHEAACLCTAHHAEDQAETFLMRAARASGLSGLAAIRARTDDSVALRELCGIERFADGGAVISVCRRAATLARPLLRWRRGELRAICEAVGAPFVDDPGNIDARFDRARFRHWLEQAPDIDPTKLARSAEHLADAEADLLAVSRWLWTERALPSGDYDVRFDVESLPRGVRRYLARMAIDHVAMVNGMPIGGTDKVGNIEPLLDALEAGKGATHAGVQASADGEVWHFREAPPRRPTRVRDGTDRSG